MHFPKAIKSLTDTYGQSISLVFGCGGDRDFKKDRLWLRYTQVQIVKKIYVTDDNL